jgi:hypothetical protein
MSAFGESSPEVSAWTLSDRKKAGEPDATNSFADPQRVRVAASQFRPSAATFAYRFPALSVTVIRWPVRIADKRGR